MKYYKIISNADEYPRFDINEIYREDFTDDPNEYYTIGELAMKFPDDWEEVKPEFKFGK